MFLDANWIIPNRLAIGAMPHRLETVWDHGFDYLFIAAAEHAWAKDIDSCNTRIGLLPLYDQPSLTLWEKHKLTLASKFIAKLVRKGFKVLIVCNAGLNRSGLVTALTIKELLKINGLTASKLVRKARKGTLQNLTYRQYVENH